MKNTFVIPFVKYPLAYFLLINFICPMFWHWLVTCLDQFVEFFRQIHFKTVNFPLTPFPHAIVMGVLILSEAIPYRVMLLIKISTCWCIPLRCSTINIIHQLQLSSSATCCQRWSWNSSFNCNESQYTKIFKRYINCF